MKLLICFLLLFTLGAGCVSSGANVNALNETPDSNVGSLNETPSSFKSGEPEFVDQVEQTAQNSQDQVEQTVVNNQDQPEPTIQNNQDQPEPTNGELLEESGNRDPLLDLFKRQLTYTDTQITGKAVLSKTVVYYGTVDQANLWLFAVPDDQGHVVMSMEKNQILYMAELDLENPNRQPDWKPMISASELGGQGVADHWHVFSNGYHYIVVSQPSANSAWILKVDRNLNRVGLKHIVDNYALGPEDGPQYYNSVGGARLITNDMFLVSEPKGVTAGFYLPGIGSKLFRMDEDLNVYEVKNIGGGELAFGNGSSVIPVDGGFHVLASDTIAHVMQSGVRLLVFNKDWEFQEEHMLVNFDHQSIGMVSGVYLPDGSLVMHARTSLDAVGRGEKAPPPTQAGDGSDTGYIARYLFDKNLELSSIEYLYDEKKHGSRPHTSLIDDMLLTSWDATNAWLLIEQIDQ